MTDQFTLTMMQFYDRPSLSGAIYLFFYKIRMPIPKMGLVCLLVCELFSVSI